MSLVSESQAEQLNRDVQAYSTEAGLDNCFCFPPSSLPSESGGRMCNLPVIVNVHSCIGNKSMFSAFIAAP